MNTIKAVARRIDGNPHHSHVLRLQIMRSAEQQRTVNFVHRLPAGLRKIVARWFPALFLPSIVVMKRLARGKDSMEPHYYKVLEPLSGTVIPTCYGLVWWEGLPALLLSEIDAIPLARANLSVFQIQDLVRSACKKIAQFNVNHEVGYLRLEDAFFVANERVMFTGLEYMVGDKGSKLKLPSMEWLVASNVSFLTDFWPRIRNSRRSRHLH